MIAAWGAIVAAAFAITVSIWAGSESSILAFIFGAMVFGCITVAAFRRDMEL
jgi:hypothetical protein